MSNGEIYDRLVKAVGGKVRFAYNWSWRSHSPAQRAETALLDGADTISAGVASLMGEGATADQIEEWTAKAIKLWLAYQTAGSRTANPMITGPARFPVERNRKALESERKRGEEYYLFTTRPVEWMARRKRSAERAELSAEAANIKHRTLVLPGVNLVQNETLDRIQLIFAGKPDGDTIALLKKAAFRWSPREGAWQRKNTNNGVRAAYGVLRLLGHEKGELI